MVFLGAYCYELELTIFFPSFEKIQFVFIIMYAFFNVCRMIICIVEVFFSVEGISIVDSGIENFKYYY